MKVIFRFILVWVLNALLIFGACFGIYKCNKIGSSSSTSSFSSTPSNSITSNTSNSLSQSSLSSSSSASSSSNVVSEHVLKISWEFADLGVENPDPDKYLDSYVIKGDGSIASGNTILANFANSIEERGFYLDNGDMFYFTGFTCFNPETTHYESFVFDTFLNKTWAELSVYTSIIPDWQMVVD